MLDTIFMIFLKWINTPIADKINTFLSQQTNVVVCKYIHTSICLQNAVEVNEVLSSRNIILIYGCVLFW